ncbi:MAG: extracellular matrix/biofilm biosynthesis regulator RemA family protein [Fervidobacterium nodosum]
MSDPIVKINDNVYVVRDRVVAIVPISSTISRRIRASNQLGGKMLNASYGKECRTVIFLNSGHSLLLAESAKEVRKKIWGD